MDTSQLLKGVLDLAVLGAAHRRRVRLRGAAPSSTRRPRRGGRRVGLWHVAQAVRGRTAHLVRGGQRRGPHRKYYGLNDQGKLRLTEATATWHGFAATLESLLGEEATV